MRHITRRVLRFAYHQADIPYYRLNGLAEVSYTRFDRSTYTLGGHDYTRDRIKIWVRPTPASLVRLARLQYKIVVDSGYCEDRWYLHGIADYVTFEFQTTKQTE